MLNRKVIVYLVSRQRFKFSILEKIKTKHKLWLSARSKNQLFFAPALRIAKRCHQFKMTILLFSAFLLLTILLIKYFARNKWNIGLKILVGFGIAIGLFVIGLNSLFDDAFGASTPVNIRTENLTDKNLKIYIIAFWSNNWNGTGEYVTYDTELKPNGKSNFWFENDGTTKFWIVAKNRNGGIEYLKVITEQKSEFDIEITETKNINPDKIQIAKELTLKKDKSERLEKYAIWSNIGLIGLLILSLLKIKTGGNNV